MRPARLACSLPLFLLSIACACACACACASGTAAARPNDSANVLSSFGQSYAPPLAPPAAREANPEVTSELTITVPPDRALLPVVVGARASSYAKAAAAVREQVAKLRAAVEGRATGASAEAACQLVVRDYSTPEPGPASSFVARAELEVDASLRGLETVEARMQRLDECFANMREVAAAGDAAAQADAPVMEVTVGSVLLTVDDPARFREPLKEQLGRRLAAVAKLEAPQWRPTDLRCHSTGIVTVEARHLSGLTLSLDARCEVVAASVAAP